MTNFAKLFMGTREKGIRKEEPKQIQHHIHYE